MLLRSAAPATIACLSLLAAGATTPAHGGAVAPLTTVRVASGLNRPIFVTHAPGDETRLFIVEQRGVIRILDFGTGLVLGTPFLDIDDDVANISGNDERGLLGMAFHPDCPRNGRFFVRYSAPRADDSSEPCFGTSRGCHAGVLAAFGVSMDPDGANPAGTGSPI